MEKMNSCAFLKRKLMPKAIELADGGKERKATRLLHSCHLCLWPPDLPTSKSPQRGFLCWGQREWAVGRNPKGKGRQTSLLNGSRHWRGGQGRTRNESRLKNGFPLPSLSF